MMSMRQLKSVLIVVAFLILIIVYGPMLYEMSSSYDLTHFMVSAWSFTLFDCSGFSINLP